MSTEDKVPEEVGEFSPIETPENIGNESGGTWLQCHPASSNQAKQNK
jgi:hypothetical protein